MKMQTVFKIFKLKIVIVLFFNFQHFLKNIQYKNVDKI